MLSTNDEQNRTLLECALMLAESNRRIVALIEDIRRDPAGPAPRIPPGREAAKPQLVKRAG